MQRSVNIYTVFSRFQNFLIAVDGFDFRRCSRVR